MMEKLPREIALEIFYRLPPESVVVCKFVCESWRNHLLPCGGDDGNYFANMHLRRRRHHHQQQRNLDYYYSTLNFISLQKFIEEGNEGNAVGEFHITEYDDEVEGRLNWKVKRLTFSQICICIIGWLNVTRLVGSCNGLLCFTITYRGGNTTLKERRIVICNPLLHEYVTLPLQFKYDATTVITGFGHNPVTDEYKVVRVYYSHDDDIGDVEVYTLGNKSSSNGMWRSKGTIKYGLRSWSLPVVINGSIHWLVNGGVSEQNIIVTLDLEDEEFRVIPLPSDLNITTNMSIEQFKELRGCLCLIGETRDNIYLNRRNLDIWVLNKDYMNKEESSWVKEFSIKWKGKHLSYSPCAIHKKKKNGDGDEILCWCNSKSTTQTLVSYDPKTQKFEKVGGRQVIDNGLIFGSVLHINSLVSLKALGEDTKYAGR